MHTLFSSAVAATIEDDAQRGLVAAAREAIAYHEAGHAIVSMRLGYRCLYVTIMPDGDRLGHACCEDPLVGGTTRSNMPASPHCRQHCREQAHRLPDVG